MLFLSISCKYKVTKYILGVCVFTGKDYEKRFWSGFRIGLGHGKKTANSCFLGVCFHGFRTALKSNYWNITDMLGEENRSRGILGAFNTTDQSQHDFTVFLTY